MAFSACSPAAVRAVLAKACAELGVNENVYQVDIYRRLAQEAKVLYDTEKSRDRVREHPLAAEIVTQHPHLVEFTVDESVMHCDADRNVSMEGAVTFDRPSTSLTNGTRERSKKKVKVDHDRMQLVYTYERRYAGEQFGTTVTFGVHVVFGYGQKTTLVQCAFRTSGRYPVSYYARQAEQEGDAPNDDAKGYELSENEDGGASDDGGDADDADNDETSETNDDGNDDDVASDEASGDEASGDEEGQSGDEEGQSGDEEGQSGDEEGPSSDEGDDEAMEVRVLGDDEKDWEYVESFQFEQETLEQVCAWLAEPSKAELTPQDALSFVLVMPFHEDEFAVDDRIFDIVFNDDSDESGDDDEDDGDHDAGDHDVDDHGDA